MKILAKTLKGFEEILAEEVRALGGEYIEILTRAVRYEGEMDLVYASNYMLRTAIRIIVPFDEFFVNDEEDLYNKIYQLEWEELFDVNQTFAIDATTSSDYFTHSMYIAQKTKDAIVDRFRDKFGKRPNVNLLNPHFRLNVHIRNKALTLSLDSSGDSLHRRGYRMNSVEAPLNEILAAGLVLLSDWDKESPFLDPMCGSGTILCEAARIAMDIPPQKADRQFGFKNWKNFDDALWQSIVRKYNSKIKETCPSIYGRDKSLRSVKASEINIEEAGLTPYIKIEKASFFKKEKPAESLTLITNPPYDERLKVSDIALFYSQIGDTLKQKYEGCSAWIISGNPEAIKSLGLRASKKITLYNGKILSKFLNYQIYAGSKKKKYLQNS